MWYSLNEQPDAELHNNQRCDTLNDLNLGWQWFDSRTVFPSCRVASTATTTARWEGTRTPTCPYPPATACSKSTVASHTCCVDNICRDVHSCSYWLGIDCLLSPLHLSLTRQWDVWWRSSYVSNWTLATDSFSCKLQYRNVENLILYVLSWLIYVFLSLANPVFLLISWNIFPGNSCKAS